MNRLLRIGHEGGTLLNLGGRFADQFLDFLRRRTRALCEAAHFRSHHREATPLLAGARRFHRGVQRQNVGLKRNPSIMPMISVTLRDDSLIPSIVSVTRETTLPPRVT